MSIFPETSGAFVATDIELQSLSKDEQIRELTRILNNFATAINQRTAGFYPRQEFVTGEVLYPNPNNTSTTQRPPTYRGVFCKTIAFGALPASGSKSVSHGILVDANVTFVAIYGAASNTNTLQYIPLNNPGITITVTSTDVQIATNTDMSNFDTTHVILKYVKE